MYSYVVIIHLIKVFVLSCRELVVAYIMVVYKSFR
jgi:hypothetical protein